MKKNFDFDDLFDEAARNQLKDFEMPFHSEDWKKFERRLDRKDHLLPHLWLYKTLEMFIMVLVVWTMFNFMYNDNAVLTANTSLATNQPALDTHADELGNANASHRRTVNTLQPATQPIATVANPTTSATHSHSNTANAPRVAANGTASATFLPSKSPARTATQARRVGYQPTPSATLNDALATLQNNANTQHNTVWNTTTTTTQTANGSGNNANTLAENNTHTAATSNQNTAAANEPTNNANQATYTTEQANQATQMGYVAIQPVALAIGQGGYTGENDPLLKLQKAKIPPAYICQHKLGVQGGVEAHSRNSNGEAARAYTLGFVAETELSRKVALSTGLQFSHRAYSFEQTTQSTTPEGLAYTRKEERTTGANVLTIPIGVQYSVYRDEKWRAYATAGVSANLVMSKRYSGTFQTYMPQATGYTRTTTNINANEYDGGILQEAKFANTAYLSVQLGAGVERQLSDEWSLFMQPTFQYGATTYGATKSDRSHVFSLYMGIKKSF